VATGEEKKRGENVGSYWSGVDLGGTVWGKGWGGLQVSSGSQEENNVREKKSKQQQEEEKDIGSRPVKVQTSKEPKSKHSKKKSNPDRERNLNGD